MRIIGGPWSWDGTSEWTSPVGGTLMLASAAAAGGYTVAPPTFTAEETNAATLREKATQALTANNTFLALASPTNAQVLAQTRTLTRECSALIRLALNLLDTTDGT